MRFFTICSSPEKGNAYFLETEHAKIVLDAGFTKRLLEQSLFYHDINPREIDAVILTHGHQNHTKGLKFLLEKNPNIVVCATKRTFEEYLSDFKIKHKHLIQPRNRFKIGDTIVYPFPVKHTAPTVNFVFESDDSCRLAYVTNSGNIDKQLWNDLEQCDSFLVESYYSPGIARRHGTWDELKNIVTTDGHLNNQDAGEIVARAMSDNLQHVILCNISRYNDPNLALFTMQSIFHEDEVNIQLAPAAHTSPWFHVFPKPKSKIFEMEETKEEPPLAEPTLAAFPSVPREPHRK